MSNPYNLYTPLPITHALWIGIFMHFVISLPRTKKGKDRIFMVVDKFSKMAYFIPCHKSDNATQVLELFVNHVLKLREIRRTIQSNRDPKFLSYFWKVLWNKLHTKLTFSTSCQPKVGGQTEVANRT